MDLLLKDENILSVGMMAMAIGILIGRGISILVTYARAFLNFLLNIQSKLFKLSGYMHAYAGSICSRIRC